MFKVNVYVAALYVAEPSSDPTAILGSGAPSEMILQFVRNVGADDLRKAWDEGFARNAKEQLPALRERITTLNGWMVGVRAGQRLTFTHKKGTIKGDDFAKAFLSIRLDGDHVTICVVDLQHGIAAYTRLEFNVYPGGVHPDRWTPAGPVISDELAPARAGQSRRVLHGRVRPRDWDG